MGRVGWAEWPIRLVSTRTFDRPWSLVRPVVDPSDPAGRKPDFVHRYSAVAGTRRPTMAAKGEWWGDASRGRTWLVPHSAR